MVGLPGSGKTQWAQKHSQENRDKRYNILGTERVLHQLRVSAHRGYWEWWEWWDWWDFVGLLGLMEMMRSMGITALYE